MNDTQKLRAHIFWTLLLCLTLASIAVSCAAPEQTAQLQAQPQLKELVATPDAVLYSRLQYTRPIADALFCIVVYGTLLQSGFAAKLQDWFSRKIPNRIAQVWAYYFFISLIGFVGCFPYIYFYSHWLPSHYDLSNMSDWQWFVERLKRFLVNATLTGIYWTLFFILVDRFKKSWHLILYSMLVPLTAFFVFLWPIAIDPIFNEFQDLPQGELRTGIEQITREAGIPNAALLVVNKSKQTKQLNAYVTGIGPSARIVLWDNIIKAMPQNELLTVVAHETGHYVLMHVYKGYALSMVALLIGLLAAGKYGTQLLARLPQRWRVKEMNDLTLIPVVLCLSGPGALLVSPVESYVSRYFEHEADQYALALTKQPISLANAFITLAKEDLIDPRPPEWIEFWFFSHPSLGRRVDFAVDNLKKYNEIRSDQRAPEASQ